MNDVERRLKEAMAARASTVEPYDERDALARIEERLNMNRRRGLVLAGAAAAIFLVAGALVLLTRGDDSKQKVNVSTDSSTESTTSSTSTTAPPPVSVVPTFEEQAIWPFASSSTVFTTPEDAARSFVVDYLGMSNARLGATNEENGTKNVEVFPNARGTARTVVRVVEQPPRGWVVFEARADEIRVEQPARNSALTSPLTISGQSTAFEATVGVQLRPFGSKDPVFQSNFMGGSNGEMGPFSTSITPPSTDQPLVLVLFEGDASGEQTFTKATVIALKAAGAPEPTEFVAVNNANELVRLDFAGHVQQTLHADVSHLSYASSRALVSFGYIGDSCATDFVSLGGTSTPSTLNGAGTALSDDGSIVAYRSCSDNTVEISGLDGSKRATVYQGERIVGLAWLGDTTLILETDNGVLLQKAVGVPDDPPATELATGVLPAVRGSFGTVAYFAGGVIRSHDPTNGKDVALVTPAAEPVSLDADNSGRYLLWVDVNHDLWKWAGGEPVKVGSGFNSAAW